MCWLDIIILLPLLIGLVRGLMRGLVTEFIAIVAVILGCVGAKMWGAMFSAWLLHQFTWPQSVCDIVAYVLLFLAVTILLNLCGKMLTSLLKAIHLGWMNRLAGAFFGTAKWLIIVMVLVFINDKIDSATHYMSSDLKKQSVTYEPMVHSAYACLSFFGIEFGQSRAND